MRPHKPQHVHRRRPSLRLPDGAIYALMVLFVLAVIGLAYLTFNGVKNLVAGAPLGVGGGFSTGEGAADLADATAQAQGSGAEMVTWTKGRVTLLLMGIDEREFEQGPWRTDTMIVLTLDPATQTAGMLSIPRDLWVEIPDYGVYDRINTAHFRGDADHYPGGGGPALAMKTVQQNFGLTINYYAVVNFHAFVTIIDRLGCIPITVQETINDPTYPAATGYGYDPFYIEAGDYCMSGETLLKYARTRATFGGDFDRARRQQQVLYAIRDHVLSTNQLPNLIAQAPEIYATLRDSVRTNLTEGEIIALMRAAASVPEERICSAVISGEYVDRLETLPDGSQVVIPNRTAIRQLVLDMLTGTGRCDPAAHNYQAEALAEHATISVLNGTRIEGRATQTAEVLTALGLNVIAVGNADRFDYASTIIYNYTGKDATARYLAAVLHVPESAIVVTSSPSGLYDIEIVLGADYTP